MPDVDFNPASFKMVYNADGTPTGHTEQGVISESVNPAETLYQSSTTGKFGRADNDDVTGKAVLAGVALGAGSADQEIVYATSGDFDVTLASGTMKAGDVFILSDTPGKVMPLADLANPQFLTFCFVVVSPTRVRLYIYNTGVVRAP